MSLLNQYAASGAQNDTEAAALLARDLMRGDAASLKQGYTFGNALYAACEQLARHRGVDEAPTSHICVVADHLHRLLAEEAGVA